MTEKLLIKRELLERIDETAICDGTDATISDDLFTQLVAALAAPRQPEGDGLEVVGWYHSHAEVATSDKVRVVQWLPECIEPLCRLSDAQRAIAELRDRLDVMIQCADNYSRMFEESAEECERLRQQLAERDAEIERLRVQLLAIFSAEPGRHNIEWAKAMAATGEQRGVCEVARGV